MQPEKTYKYMKWVKCSKVLPNGEDWYFLHYRYAEDHVKLDTDLFYVKDGGLVKVGGTGRLEFTEVEYLDETPSQETTKGWISIEDELPPYLETKDYSANVFVICNGKIEIMCRAYDAMADGWVWANCHGNINVDGEVDDDYKVTHWMPLPQLQENIK